MNRRAYLAAIPAVAGSGCAGQSLTDSEESQTSTETETTGSPSIQMTQFEAPNRVRQPDANIPVIIKLVNDGSKAGQYRYYLTDYSLGDYTELSAETPPLEGTLPAGERMEIERSITPNGSGILELRTSELTSKVTVEPESKGPRIQEVESLSDWQSYGDVIKNAGEPVEPGEDALLGIRYLFWHDDGTLDYRLQANLYDPDGSQVEVVQGASERLTDAEGWSMWETAQPFRLPESAQPGQYQVEVLMRNRTAGETGERVTGDIEVQK